MPKSSLNSLYRIVARKISGQASKSENLKFEKWIASSHKAKDIYGDLERIWSNRYFGEEDQELVSQEEVSDKIWQSAFGKTEPTKKWKMSRSFLLKLAAAIIFFLTTLFAVYYMIDTNPEEISHISVIHKKTLPGQKSIITLRDGTVVSLNSGSKISYMSDFNDSLRIIELKGQAFFEVFKDPTKPFIVKCRNLEVKALGTSFDVNGYKDKSITVSLMTGSVLLSVPLKSERAEMILNPGEYTIVNKDDKFVRHGIFDPYELLAWKDGRLIFKNQTLKEIVPKLELWYGVDIQLESSFNSNKTFSSTFVKENLQNILLNMGTILEFNYIIDGNNITITQNVMPM